MSELVSDRFGVVHEKEHDRRAKRLIVLSIFGPLVGSLYAVIGPPSVKPTWLTAMVFLPLFIGTALGINLGLHRYFTHVSFKTHRWVRFLIATFASFAIQGPIAIWVANHRRHHRFTDRPGDPHSPYLYEDQPFHSRLAGFWHAHLLWLFRPGVSDVRRYAKDILADPITRWQSRYYWLMCVCSLGIPTVIGYWLNGSDEAVRCFLWGGCVRVTVLNEVTRAVNSYCHMFGTKEVEARDESRNIPWSFCLWFGEGLHSYHHKYPSSAVMEPAVFDPVGQVILIAQRAGLVWDVRRTKTESYPAPSAQKSEAENRAGQG